jgi:hypothetical protein
LRRPTIFFYFSGLAKVISEFGLSVTISFYFILRVNMKSDLAFTMYDSNFVQLFLLRHLNLPLLNQNYDVFYLIFFISDVT